MLPHSIAYSLSCVIYHLRANERDGSTFEPIHMSIIDTSTFPDSVFLRDLDLVRCYRAYDQSHNNSSDSERLRLKKQESFSGHFYFGEYLSQGALKIAHNDQFARSNGMKVRKQLQKEEKLVRVKRIEIVRPPLSSAI